MSEPDTPSDAASGADASSASAAPSDDGKPPSPLAGVALRPAELADVPALLALEDAAFPGDRLSRASFRRHVGKPTNDLLVAVDPDGALLGYALVLYREGSRVGRLYSIAVAQAARGRGLARQLLDAAEHAAAQHARTIMRLEVRADNAAAIRLYQSRSYRETGRIADYYADHQEALRFERALVPEHPPGPERVVPYFAQTTEFTCGPAAMSMVLAAFDRAVPDAAFELQLWREANCVYLLSAPGGCDPIGLALAGHRRGLRTTVHVSHPGPYFVEVTRGATPRAVMSHAQALFLRDAAQTGLPIHYEALPLAELVAALDRGALAIVLVSPWLLIRSTVPHWILAYARTDKAIMIHDPYHDPDPTRAPGHEAVAIPFHDFVHMSTWGKTRLSATILLEAPPTP